MDDRMLADIGLSPSEVKHRPGWWDSHFLKLLVSQRLAQVDAEYFGTDHAGGRVV